MFHAGKVEDSDTEIKLATLKRILPFFKGHGKSITIALVSVLTMAGVTAGLPLIFRHLIDVTIPSKDVSRILKVGSFYLVLLVLKGGLEYVQNLIVGYMGIEIVNDIKDTLLKHIIRLSVSFFDKYNPGELISRIESDSQKLYMVFSTVGLKLLSGVTNLVISFGIMFAVSWKLTLFVVAIIPVYVLGTYLVFSKMRPMFRKNRSLYARIVSFLGEHIKAIPVLRNLNNLNWSIEKFFGVNDDRRRYEVKIYILEYTVWFILLLTPQLAVAGILYQSVSWIQAELITVGTVVMFIQYIENAVQPLMMISEQIGEIQRAFGAADRIFTVLDREPDVQEARNPVGIKSFQDKIRYEDVNFEYEEDEKVLKDVSFTIEKGETVALVGPTGSGKTTITSLLARFYDPQKGKITIDGTDIRNIKLDDLRGLMSIVLQDIYLFPGTVMDNLRMMREDIPESKAKLASEKMGIQNIIEDLPRSYRTELAEEGTNLSFGERQLLSFSRALTFDPQILIMDEATSSVDPHTEEKIQRSMKQLTGERTSIVIAHRLSTIRGADKILVIHRGQIWEEGTHGELLREGGKYAELYYSQIESRKSYA